ncbi:MAG: OmpA family protein [Bradyrhizobium sp.]|uniref:OmpA family protein n=1 Tax=Bradyrhizobium sp. TaxID=376 RepID=UPI003D130215
MDADKSDVLWRAAVTLGDLKFVQRKFAEATAAYERALENIKNTTKTPKSPDVKDIKAIFDQATEAKMLAANEDPGGSAIYVGAAKDHRDNTLGGTMSVDIRGFKPTAVPIPIGFETASTRFTRVGEKAANELLQAIRQQDPGELILVGHTDERGQADYNVRLSADRAKAVADFLKQNGVAARITTIAKGESEPLQLQDTSGLTREDIWALNRRVVWVRR